MFLIVTKENYTVNLAQWEGLKILPGTDKVLIVAFNDYVIGRQTRNIIISEHKDIKEAEDTLQDLFKIINDGGKIWYAP